MKPYFRCDYSKHHSSPCWNTVCVPLTKGYHALVDAEDFDSLVSNYYWSAAPSGYAYRNTFINEVKENYYLHKEVMRAPKAQMVDHINGVRWDNRKSNLRYCTHAENIRNSKAKRGTYKGVYFVNRKTNLKKRWFAQIKMESKVYNIGYFLTDEEAALAYNEAAIKLHGAFARLNSVNQPQQ